MNDLETLLNSTFSTFSVPIHNDYRIFQDFSGYLQKLDPFHFQINENIVMDAMYDIQNTWVLYLEIGIFIGATGCYLLYWRYSEKKLHILQ